MRAAQRLFVLAAELRTPILLVSLFFILVGSRAALIGYASNPTPFLDEWDADAAHLLKPFLQGDLSLSDFLIPINEHRIPFTKLLVLSIFHISGYWDVVLQMIVNAIVDSATIVAIAYGLSRVLHGGFAVAAMVLSAAINAAPYGYENVVLGFNTHFYLLLTFSFASLWLLTDSRAWSLRWASGVVLGVCSALCLASGALTLAAVAGGQLLQAACGRRAGLGEWLGIAGLAAIALALASAIPYVPAAEGLKPHSIGQFLRAVVALARWPAHSSVGLIFLLPSAVFVVRALRACPALTDPRWFNVMALSWVLGQVVALAAGRAQIPLVYRYSDILLVGVTINIVSAFWLFEAYAAEGKPRIWRSLMLVTWLFVLTLSLIRPHRHLPDSIEEWRTILAAGEQNVRHYLASGDPSFLAHTPAAQIPSFDSDRLRELLDAPEIRSALPPELVSRDAPHPWVEASKAGFARLSGLWSGLGGLLLAIAIASKPIARRWAQTPPLIKGDRAAHWA
jgi:hypothetical protein